MLECVILAIELLI